MIDTPEMPSDAEKWHDEIAKKGEVVYLINTEPHVDHVSSNHLFSGIGVAHQGTREEMRRYQKRLPNITFSHRLYLYLGDRTFELVHLPGHTASETAVCIPEERVVFTGDNVFHKVQSWLYESLPMEWLESLKKIERLDVDTIVPGHGEVCDKGYLKEQAAFIEEWIEAVKKAIEQGLSQKEAAERISFLDRYPMDVGLDRMGPMVQRMNVYRLYDVLKGDK